MTTPDPTPAPIHFRSARDRDLFEESVRFRVITPVFGGGVWLDPDNKNFKPCDPITPIRPPSVRGQLRFWWRATRGLDFESVPEMRAAEDALWGNASVAGKVSLSIKQDNISAQDYRIPDRLSYGAFPLSIEEGQNGTLSKFTGEATLRLVGPENKLEEVKKAVKAWLAFGGFGGRTRRGFGAVAPIGENLDPEKILQMYTGEKTPRGFSTLANARCWCPSKTWRDGESALAEGLKKLKTFRSELRWLQKKHQSRQTRTPGVFHFPRAGLGLPMKLKNGNFLKPVNAERRPSRAIIRPFQSGRKFKILFLALQDPNSIGEELTSDRPLREKSVADISHEDASKLCTLDKRHHQGQYIDIVEVFISWLENPRMPSRS